MRPGDEALTFRDAAADHSAMILFIARLAELCQQMVMVHRTVGARRIRFNVHSRW